LDRKVLVSEPRSGDKLGLQGLLSSFSEKIERKKNPTLSLEDLNALEHKLTVGIRASCSLLHGLTLP